MVLYFSGTGNSKYVAKTISQKANHQLISINQKIKADDYEKITTQNPLVFVCPTYAWRMPRLVDDFIMKTEFSGNHEVYFVLTCGDDTYGAVDYVKKLCYAKGFKFMGFTQVKMPENYVALFETPDNESAKKIILKSQKRIEKIIYYIKNENRFPEFKKKKKIFSVIANPLFYKFVVSDKGFHVATNCTGCGDCARHCPLNNIQLENNKPIWMGNCTHCMACIAYCPQKAIEYKQATQNKNKYSFEKIEKQV